MKSANICQDVSRLPGRLPYESHFSWKNSIEHLSISCMQFNLIYKTLHNVTFSIKNKWCRLDIWRVDIYFLTFQWYTSRLPVLGKSNRKVSVPIKQFMALHLWGFLSLTFCRLLVPSSSAKVLISDKPYREMRMLEEVSRTFMEFTLEAILDRHLGYRETFAADCVASVHPSQSKPATALHVKALALFPLTSGLQSHDWPSRVTLLV